MQCMHTYDIAMHPHEQSARCAKKIINEQRIGFGPQISSPAVLRKNRRRPPACLPTEPVGVQAPQLDFGFHAPKDIITGPLFLLFTQIKRNTPTCTTPNDNDLYIPTLTVPKAKALGLKTTFSIVSSRLVLQSCER
jgi:hypothetical protein